jgi:hypothetical protein
MHDQLRSCFFKTTFTTEFVQLNYWAWLTLTTEHDKFFSCRLFRQVEQNWRTILSINGPSCVHISLDGSSQQIFYLVKLALKYPTVIFLLLFKVFRKTSSQLLDCFVLLPSLSSRFISVVLFLGTSCFLLRGISEGGLYVCDPWCWAGQTSTWMLGRSN